jgi:hypothetical protein
VVSWQHARAVLDLEGVKPTPKFVLIAIALRAGTDGRAWPSIARISADTGYGRSTVRAAIGRLARTGHLEVVHKPGATLMLTLTAPDAGPPTAPDNGATAPANHQNRARYRPLKKDEEIKKGATTGSSAKRPAVAWEEKADGTVVVHKLEDA